MAKFCSNCGKPVDEKAVICVNCGVPLTDITNLNQTGQQKYGKGKGIASLILGIVGFLYALLAFAAVSELEYELIATTTGYRFGYAIGFILIQSIFAIISLCLALVERKNEKNGFNTAGFVLSILIFVCAALQFVLVMSA